MSRLIFFVALEGRGGFRISGKGVHIHKGVGGCFVDFISFLLNISMRPNYYIFLGYLKTGRGGEFERTPSESATGRSVCLAEPHIIFSTLLGEFSCFCCRLLTFS